jgi:uncharacterized protein YdaU (DUF1376 family)
MGDLPSMPFYVDDFEAHTAHLSLEEDGAYNRLLRLCWRSPGCSVPYDPAWLARKLRISQADYERVAAPVIAEFFTIAKGRMWQKRQRQEHAYVSTLIERRKAAGSKGGVARALKRKDIDPSKTKDLPLAKRKQNVAPIPTSKPTPTYEEKSGADAPSDLLGNLSLPSSPDLAAVAVKMWNDLAGKHGLAKVQQVTDRRRSSLKARLKEFGGLEGWAAALEKVEASPFLLGQKTDFRADFDFLLQQKSFTKLMEGGYSGGGGGGDRPRPGSPAMAHLRRMQSDH